MHTINFLGCGRLGQTLARLFYLHQAANIQAVVNTTIASAQSAVDFIGQGSALADLNNLPPADIYFITSPDNKIQSICETLVTRNLLKPNTLVVHCSGTLSADILSTAKQAQCKIASVHPIKSFANPKQAVDTFAQTYCSFEGDAAAFPILNAIFTKIGANFFALERSSKTRYHAAAVLANNYLVTLHYIATQNFIQAGIQAELAKKLTSNLMQDALNNVANTDHQQALTGPIARADIETIEKHLTVISQNDLHEKIYKMLGMATLDLTNHSNEVKSALIKILKND